MRFQVLGPGDPTNSVGDATITYYYYIVPLFNFCTYMSIFHLNYLVVTPPNNSFFKVWHPLLPPLKY